MATCETGAITRAATDARNGVGPGGLPWWGWVTLGLLAGLLVFKR